MTLAALTSNSDTLHLNTRMFQEKQGLKMWKLIYKSEFTFWPAHLILLMPFLPHNLAEFCKLHLLDQSKIWVLSDPRGQTPTHLQNEEPRHQSRVESGLFYLQYVQFLQKMISHRGHDPAPPQCSSDLGTAACSQRSARGRAGRAQGGGTGRLAWRGWHREAAGAPRAAAEVDPGCGRHSLCSSCALGGVAVPAGAGEGAWGCLSLSSQQLALLWSAQISPNALESFRIKGTM